MMVIINKFYFDENINTVSEKEAVLSSLLESESLYINAVDENIKGYSVEKENINDIIKNVEEFVEKISEFRSEEKEEKVYLRYTKLINLLIAEKIYYLNLIDQYNVIIQECERLKELKKFQSDAIKDINNI